MNITINSTEYHIKWKHTNNTWTKESLKGENGYKESGTICWIENIGGKELCHGHAVMHKSDKNFNKDIGRKVSLANMLKTWGYSSSVCISKGIRTYIWNEYFKMTNKLGYVKEC